jgi:hypothetical protein
MSSCDAVKVAVVCYLCSGCVRASVAVLVTTLLRSCTVLSCYRCAGYCLAVAFSRWCEVLSHQCKSTAVVFTPVTHIISIPPICQAEEALQEAARVMQERKQREDEERARKEYEMNGWDRTLPVVKFKALWASLATAGSFQCNLKALPAITNLTEHLKKQGELLRPAVLNVRERIDCSDQPVSSARSQPVNFCTTVYKFTCVLCVLTAVYPSLL